MNLVFYAMVFVAFVVAGGREILFDTQVTLTKEDGQALVEHIDAEGPGALQAWLDDVGTQRGTDYRGQMLASSWLDREAFDQALDQELRDRPNLSGKAVVRVLERVGDFQFGELRPMEALGAGLFEMSKIAVTGVILPLIGVMAFFLGLMKVAEKAGAMTIIAKILRPVMVLLFPDVPPTHPAMSAMILNMAANALGLGNAATPFGIRAMEELDKLNPEEGTATNAMCLFLAINTSSVTILPTGVIAIRAALGSTDAVGILPTTLFATILSTTTAIVATKIYQRFSRAPQGAPYQAAAADAKNTEDPLADAGSYPIWVSLLAGLGLIGLVVVSLAFGKVVGPWLVPLIVVGFLTFGVVRGVKIYEAFIEGARDGWTVAVRIVPYLVAILAAIGMLRGSGAIDLFVDYVGPITSLVGLPAEAVPMALLRPLSGSGAYGVMMATLEEHGPDSYIGYIVSTLQGSTETTFYVIAVYFGAVSVSRIRHAMAAALTADVMGVVGAVTAVSAYFYFMGL